MTILTGSSSDAEEESESEDEEDGFGPSKKVEQDPMDREYHSSCRVSCQGNITISAIVCIVLSILLFMQYNNKLR